MNYVKGRSLFGNGPTREIPCLTGKGKPTTAVEGAVGCLYMDTDSGNLYKCTAAADGVYTWELDGSSLYYIPVVSQPTDSTLKFEFEPSVPGAPIPKPVTVELPVGSGDCAEDVYTLPVATAERLGGVMPESKSDNMTQAVGVDENGRLFTVPGTSAALSHYSEVNGGGVITNAKNSHNEIWSNWNGRLGFGMNTANAPVPFWVHGQILADGTIIARNVASGMQDQVNNRWGMHLFEGYSTDDYSRFTILADKFEHDYRKVACVYYYTGASEADSAYGFVKLGSDAEMHSFDFTRDLLQAHGVIDCRMPITLARISLTNDIDTTYETVEEADAAHAAGTEWEANLRCLRYIYLKNAANGSMFYDADIHAPVIKVDGSWCKIPTEKLTDERYTVLGQEFDPVPCTGLTLSASALTFANTSLQTLTAAPTPADTTDRVVWESSDPSIATVKNGVVTPKWNGICTIKATCGNVQAECAVTISGVEFEPIDTISLTAGYKYDTTTGEPVAAEGYFCTNKFRLSDGHWQLTNRAHQSSVLVWDADDNYLGSHSVGWNHPNTDTTMSRNILARADCKYAIHYGYEALEDDLTLMSITKVTASTKIGTVTLDLAECEFVDSGNYAVFSLANVAGFSSISAQATLLTSLETASIPVMLFGPGGSSYANGTGYGLASIGWVKDEAGTYKPHLIFAGTAADANAYFAEHQTVLTIN